MFEFITGPISNIIGDISRFIFVIILGFITIVALILIKGVYKFLALIIMIAIILFVWFYEEITSIFSNIVGLI